MLNNHVELSIELKNKKPKDSRQVYRFYHIDGNFGECENQDIIQKIKSSKIVFIYISDDKTNEMFIGLQNTIIYVQNASGQLLINLFSENSELKFLFQHDKKDILKEIINIPKEKIFQFSTSFDDEIKNFNNCLKLNLQSKYLINEMEKSIKTCISGYLIGKSYFESIEQQKRDFWTIVNAGTNPKLSKA